MNKTESRCPTHPGEFLREIIIPNMDVSRKKLAEALGVSRQTLYDILSERRSVTPNMALRLGIVFDTTPESWLKMQWNYDLWVFKNTVDFSQVRRLT